MTQPPLANLVTLGAVDFGAPLRFYQQLGWPQAVEDHDDFAAFELRGIVLALFPVERLAQDGRVEPNQADRHGLRGTIAVLVDEPAEVDALVERMRQAGGTVTKDPVDGEFFEGRSAYVADPEGNYWEIAWSTGDNPVVDAARPAAGLG